jgi:hypothetical protein
MALRKNHSTHDASPSPEAASTLLAKSRTALATIHALGASLPLDEGAGNDPKTLGGKLRVPPHAIELAAAYLEQHPDRFHEFDAKSMRGALEFEQSLLPLATGLGQLAKRIVRTVRRRRADAATQTLALYQALKGLVRLTAQDAAQVSLDELEAAISTSRRRRATTVTQKEVNATKTTLRKAKIAAVKAAEAKAAADAATRAARDAGIEASPSAPAVTNGAGSNAS